jgi:hypothetical protein
MTQLFAGRVRNALDYSNGHDFPQREQPSELDDRRKIGSSRVRTPSQWGLTRCPLCAKCGCSSLLSTHRRAVLSQPRCQLRFLLGFQIDTVVDALDRLPVGPLRRFDLVRGVKLHDLVAHVGIAE